MNKCIMCKIINKDNTSKTGVMIQRTKYNFKQLLEWVKRICGGCLQIKSAEEKEKVLAVFEDRAELYYFAETNKKFSKKI